MTEHAVELVLTVLCGLVTLLVGYWLGYRVGFKDSAETNRFIQNSTGTWRRVSGGGK